MYYFVCSCLFGIKMSSASSFESPNLNRGFYLYNPGLNYQDAFLDVNGDPAASEFDVDAALAAYVRAAEEEMGDEGEDEEEERPLWQVPLIV